MALIEREHELARLEAVVKEGTGGRGATLLIEGPPGIGKTSLLEGAAAFADEVGMRVLRVRASELERDLGFAVVRGLFEAAVTSLSTEERTAVMSGAAHLSAAPLGLDSVAEPGLVELGSAIHGLYWLAANLSDREPLLLAIDDLHWADDASLTFLAYLAHRAEEHSLVVCATTRPPATEPTERHLRALAEHGEVLRPASLSVHGVAAIATDMFDAAVEPEFSAACARLSGGNPFLLIEALGTVLQDGVTPSAAHAERLRELHPESLARSLRGRVARLGPTATQVARAAAILEADADLRRVSLMTDLALTDVAAATSGLRREGILASAEGLEFTHPLIHTAIHADIPEPDRGLGHLRAARLLAADGEESRVPSHLLVAEPNGDPWVLDQLSRAAAKAASRGAPGTAAVLLRRALVEPPVKPERPRFGLRLGQALGLSGELDAAADVLRAALDLAGASDARVEIALVLGRVLRMTDRIPEAIAVLDDAAGRLPSARHEDYLSLELELAIAGHMGRPAKDWVDRFAGAVTRATGTSPADRTLRGFYGYVAASTGTETAAEVSRLARSSITALGQPDQPMMLQGVAAGLAMSGAFAEALDVLDRALAISQEAGDAVQFGFLSMTRTWVAHRSGRVLEGEADAQAILDIPSIGHLYASYAVAHVAVAMMERGSVDDATRLMADHGYLDTTELDSLPGAVVHHVRGRLHRLSGRPKEAVADYRRCRQTVLTAGFVGPAFGEWRMDGALAHLALGQRDEAREIVFEDLELARSFGAPREIGIALRTSGLVEGGAAGLERLAESVDVLATSEAVLDHAKALVEQGAALRRAGRNAAAADRLRNGLDLASRCAATATVTRALDELRAAGSRPRRERLSGPDSLTASELRVARMAAEGRSNPEIAQLLFVTRRTVEVHLTHVYRKLEIASRDDLASALDLS